MSDSERIFAHGSPNPEHFGFVSLRGSAGDAPDEERLKKAARLLNREVFFIDDDGYERELIGAAISPTGRIAHVESATKDVGPHPHGAGGRNYEVSIRIHQQKSDGSSRSVEIESYNPFFGCDVRFFEWVGDSAILIYREKHWTFAYRFGDLWPPKFAKIEDCWLIHDDQLAYIGYKEDSVRRLQLPNLEPLEPLSLAEATEYGLAPKTYWT